MRRILIAAVVALFLTVEAAPAQNFPVGFVDVQKVFADYKKAKELQDQLAKDFEQAQNAQRLQREKVSALKEGLDIYVPGTKEYLDQVKKIRLAEVEIELNEQVVKLDLQVRWAESLRKIYAEIQREVKAAAEEKGLKLVLRYQAADIKARTKDDVMNNILVRPVLYFDPTADLTNELLARLNK